MLSKRIRISPRAMDGLAAHRSIYERGGILCGVEHNGGTVEVVGVESAPDSTLPSTHNFHFSAIPPDACAPAKVVGLFHTHPHNSGPSDVDRESSQRMNGIDCVVADDGVFCYKGNDNLGFFRYYIKHS